MNCVRGHSLNILNLRKFEPTVWSLCDHSTTKYIKKFKLSSANQINIPFSLHNNYLCQVLIKKRKKERKKKKIGKNYKQGGEPHLLSPINFAGYLAVPLKKYKVSQSTIFIFVDRS